MRLFAEEPVIIYSTGENVHSYNLVSNSSQVMVRNLDHVVGVFADKDNLYWTDVGREASIIKSDRKNFNKSIAIYGKNNFCLEISFLFFNDFFSFRNQCTRRHLSRLDHWQHILYRQCFQEDRCVQLQFDFVHCRYQ